VDESGPTEIEIRSPAGRVLRLPKRWAVLLAENLRSGPRHPDDIRADPKSYATDAARSAAEKVELRLTDADRSPVEFAEDEVIEVREVLNAVCVGWHKSQGGAWETSDALAFYRGFESSAGGPTESLDP
jgi:hypothetical protein